MSYGFTYLLYDLVTNQPIAQVPFSSVQFSSVLNNSGSFSGTLWLADPKVRQALDGVDIPGLCSKTAIYVDYQGSLLWGGIIWTTNFDSTQPGKPLQVGGNDFWSYFSSRVISWYNQPDGATLLFTDEDQLTVAESLVNSAQSLPGGNIGVTVPSNVSGVPVGTVSWSTSQSVTIAQAMQTLATQAGAPGEGESSVGFDLMADVTYTSAGTPARALTLSWPRRGRPAGTTGLVFNLGNAWAQGYQWPNDGTQQANTVFGIGAGGGASSTTGGPLRAVVALPSYITGSVPGGVPDGRWPLLEATLSRTDINQQPLLYGTTASYAAAVAKPVALPVITFSLDQPSPALGDWLVGDDTRIVIPPDEYFTAGLDTYMRITQQQVTVNDAGISTVALTLQNPPLAG